MVTDIETLNNILASYVADVKKEMPIDKVYLFGTYIQVSTNKNVINDNFGIYYNC
ncbi:MAG: hypothetical protein LBH98_00395 [Chitinispirillales bacterium]|jgi:uncharacterized protein YpmS|nr:hypothetical protein [Chitinispirillales bacterium]